MVTEPPPFHESARCDVCKCSFSTFRRRHHCRCCGRTLCHDHSSYQTPLPQFGIGTNVRVCYDCFNNFSSKTDSLSNAYNTNTVAEEISVLDINQISETKVMLLQQEQSDMAIIECKCGMPLCICEASAPPRAPSSMEEHSKPLNPRTKKMGVIHKSTRSTQETMRSSNLGIGPSSGLETSHINYDVNGEGLREAIKNSDTFAVKELLRKGVDPNYCDKQGSFLLHLAAVFNKTDIAFALMEHGAKLDSKNPQGETPLDCAPPTLKYKMQMKKEDGGPNR